MLFAFIIYLCFLLIIGIAAHRHSRSERDFAVGNRKLNFWLTSLSAHASDMSAWLFISLPSIIFLQGMGGCWIALGLIFGMWISWQFIAPRLRRLTEFYDVYTLSSLIEKHYKTESHWIRVSTAVLILVFMTHYLTAGLMAVGIVLESSFGLPYILGVIIATVIIVTYTYIGGFVTVAWTDFFQAIFLMGVIIAVPVVGYIAIGGFDSIATAASERALSINPFDNFSWLGGVQIILSAIGWGLGYFGLPHVLTKFLGIQNPDELKKAKYLGITWQTAVLAGSIAIGLVAVGYFNDRSIDPQLLFVEMTTELFAPFVAGLFICGLLAANISTMDSQILVSATLIAEDLYSSAFPEKNSSQHLLKITRLGVIATAVVACLLSFDRNATIQETVAYSWAGLGCTLGPVMLATLFIPRTNAFGAFAGILVGGFVATFWPMISPSLVGDTFEILATVPGYLLALPTIAVVSHLTREK
ncbi:MAG: sodium/proline symporter [Chlamydiia bacterium]|nr:sodium/proline symporter [Chlamydiia bacterium]